jgi:hypothetical protein
VLQKVLVEMTGVGVERERAFGVSCLDTPKDQQRACSYEMLQAISLEPCM